MSFKADLYVSGMDDCLSDCAGAMEDVDGKPFFEILMTCMKEAGYDCDAMDECGEAAGVGSVGADDQDVVLKSMGSDVGEDATPAGSPDSASTDSGGSGSSCSMARSAKPSGIGPVILLCFLFFVLVGKRKRPLQA